MDGTEKLCRALYQRAPQASDYVGGSDARMLHDAAEAIARLTRERDELRTALEASIRAEKSAIYTAGHIKQKNERRAMERDPLRAAIEEWEIIHAREGGRYYKVGTYPLEPGYKYRIQRRALAGEEG